MTTRAPRLTQHDRLALFALVLFSALPGSSAVAFGQDAAGADQDPERLVLVVTNRFVDADTGEVIAQIPGGSKYEMALPVPDPSRGTDRAPDRCRPGWHHAPGPCAPRVRRQGSRSEEAPGMGGDEGRGAH